MDPLRPPAETQHEGASSVVVRGRRARREPTSPCLAFERTFALELAKSFASAEPSIPVVRLGGACTLPAINPRASEVTEPSCAPVQALAAGRRPALIPRSALLVALLLAAGIAADEAKTGRLPRVASAAAAVAASARQIGAALTLWE